MKKKKIDNMRREEKLEWRNSLKKKQTLGSASSFLMFKINVVSGRIELLLFTTSSAYFIPVEIY